MKETAHNPIYAAKAVLFTLILTVAVTIGPAGRSVAQTGMQTIAQAPAGDGESCPRNPGEKAGQHPPVLMIPETRPSPLQPAVYIEMRFPAEAEQQVVRYRI